MNRTLYINGTSVCAGHTTSVNPMSLQLLYPAVLSYATDRYEDALLHSQSALGWWVWPAVQWMEAGVQSVYPAEQWAWLESCLPPQKTLSGFASLCATGSWLQWGRGCGGSERSEGRGEESGRGLHLLYSEMWIVYLPL